MEIKKKKNVAKKKIYIYILLVLPIEEISLRPELSSPAHFRILGGYPERDGAGRSRTEEILVSNIGWWSAYSVIDFFRSSASKDQLPGH